MVRLARTATFVLALAAPALLGGCMVGHPVILPSSAEPAEGDGGDWSRHAFAVAGAPDARWAATHALRRRHGVLDVRPAPGAPRSFALEVKQVPSVESASIPAMLSMLSLSLVPGFWDARVECRFTLSAPDGAVLEGAGTRRTAMLSWAPFLLLGPTLVFAGPIAIDEPEEDRLRALEELVGRFLAGAAPFVATHGAAELVTP